MVVLALDKRVLGVHPREQILKVIEPIVDAAAVERRLECLSKTFERVSIEQWMRVASPEPRWDFFI